MRHGPAGRRLRNRGGGGGSGGSNNNPRRGNGHSGGPSGNRNQVFDSSGPDVRIRGTAHQIQEKYATLAKDAALSGDRIVAESYLQHAEHYQRIINSWIEQMGGRETYFQEEDDQEEAGGDGRFDIRPPRRPAQERPDLGLQASIVGEAQPTLPSELTEA